MHFGESPASAFPPAVREGLTSRKIFCWPRIPAHMRVEEAGEDIAPKLREEARRMLEAVKEDVWFEFEFSCQGRRSGTTRRSRRPATRAREVAGLPGACEGYRHLPLL